MATITLWNSDSFSKVVMSVFECEALGQGKVACSTDGLDQFHTISLNFTVLYAWMGVYPSTFYVNLINLRKCKEITLYAGNHRTLIHPDHQPSIPLDL